MLPLFTPLKDKNSLELPGILSIFENPFAYTVALVILTVFLLSAIAYITSDEWKIWIGLPLFVIALSGCMSLVAIHDNANNRLSEIFESNKVTISDNIKDKYLIKDVVWDSMLTHVQLDPHKSLNDQSVLVEDMEGNRIVLGYSIQDSGEVTLHDMPTFAGSTNDEPFTAKSLLK